MHVWENNHWKDSKIENSTGCVWACMHAYAFTQSVLMYSSNTEGSWLCYTAQKQKPRLKIMAPCHQGLRVSSTPFNKVDNLLLILYLLSALCGKSFKSSISKQLQGAHWAHTRWIFAWPYQRYGLWSPFKEGPAKREKSAKRVGRCCKLLAIAKLEPSRRVNSDLCIPDLPLCWDLKGQA